MEPSHLPIRAAAFESLAAADRAAVALLEAGFPKESLSIVCAHPARTHRHRADVEHVEPAGAHTPEAAAVGGTIGSILGGLTAAVGIAATGGTGLLVAGPLLGAAATGGVVGGFIGAMTRRGIEPDIADFYDQALQRGQTLVAVEDSASGPGLLVAEQVFARCGADAIPLRKG